MDILLEYILDTHYYSSVHTVCGLGEYENGVFRILLGNSLQTTTVSIILFWISVSVYYMDK